MVERPPPVTPEPDGEEKPEFGSMTRAWFDAGREVADYEAGRAAERRRIILATAGVLIVVGGVVAAVLFIFN